MLAVRILARAAIVLVAVTALPIPASASGTFIDDDGNVHESYIEAIAAEGITIGCNPPRNDRFCPGEEVSRGQMAAFLARALHLSAVGQDHFVDDGDSVFEGEINALAAAKITAGCNPPVNDRFCPDLAVTRSQMAAFLTRAFGFSDGQSADLFVDDDGSIFERDINALATARVTLGCNPPRNDRFCPNESVERDQMASFIGRALNLDLDLEPENEFACTEVVGFSQTNQWYQGDPLGNSPFEALVGDSGWQLRYEPGSSIGAIAEDDWVGWHERPVSSCSTGVVDRVILTITGASGSRVEAWSRDIREAVVTVRAQHPNVEEIVLQPVVGGPNDQTCTHLGQEVRASFQNPFIFEAIARVAAADTGTEVGADAEVASCLQYADALGHLTPDGAAEVGARLGEYYADG